MFYKIFAYTLERGDVELDPTGHFEFFQRSIGQDQDGNYTEYRRQSIVLMNLINDDGWFMGLVGKHSTEREVTHYENSNDTIAQQIIGDDDYPHTPFICVPSLHMMACGDSGPINARSAMRRLHKILAHRAGSILLYDSLRQFNDLRTVTSLFRVTEVDYEVLPVNPTTGDLGQLLDESRKRDHIEKMKGRVSSTEDQSMILEGGFLTQIAELQQSGHSRVGFTGIDDQGVEIKVSKPARPEKIPEEPGESRSETLYPEMRVSFRGMSPTYPLTEDHAHQLIAIMRKLRGLAVDASPDSEV